MPAWPGALVAGDLALRTCPEGPVAVLGCGFGDEGECGALDALARARPVRFDGVLLDRGTRCGPGPFVAGPRQGPVRVAWLDLDLDLDLDLVLTRRGRGQISGCAAWTFADDSFVRGCVPVTGRLEHRLGATCRLAEARPVSRHLTGWSGPNTREGDDFLKWIAPEPVVPGVMTAWDPRASDQRSWSAFEGDHDSGK